MTENVLHRHPKTRNFTQVENSLVRDGDLSFRATGLLVYLLSLPDGSAINSSTLARAKSEGRDAIRSAIKELEQFGYVVRTKAQGKDGRWATETHVYEEPAPENPASEPRPSETQALSLSESKTDETEDSVRVREPHPSDAVAMALCERLAHNIELNGSKRPTITKRWHDAARLMLVKDGYLVRDIETLIDWSQNDEFWRANILSMPKLREKYETLRLQAQRQPKRSRRDAKTQRLLDLRTQKNGSKALAP
jgi:hypothetical protein